MFGAGEQDIQLPVPIWVHLIYQTAFVDDTGKLQTRRDLCNIDSRTMAAIKSERGMIEAPQERNSTSRRARRRAIAPQQRRGSCRSSRRCSAAAARRRRQAGAAAARHADSRLANRRRSSGAAR